MEPPRESATLFKIGTKKIGFDGNDYYVSFDKNNIKRWVKESCIFVMYKININATEKYWKYGKMPKNWSWIGGGTTVPIQKLNDNTIKYPQEEQFMGDPKYKIKMKEILSNFFQKLKDKQIIENYKLVTEIGLQNYMRKINI